MAVEKEIREMKEAAGTRSEVDLTSNKERNAKSVKNSRGEGGERPVRCMIQRSTDGGRETFT